MVLLEHHCDSGAQKNRMKELGSAGIRRTQPFTQTRLLLLIRLHLQANAVERVREERR
jgi:hypothetical protein